MNILLNRMMYTLYNLSAKKKSFLNTSIIYSVVMIRNYVGWSQIPLVKFKHACSSETQKDILLMPSLYFIQFYCYCFYCWIWQWEIWQKGSNVRFTPNGLTIWVWMGFSKSSRRAIHKTYFSLLISKLELNSPHLKSCSFITSTLR